MWQRPWRLKESIAICIGLVFIGLILQYCTGGMVWENLSWPLNAQILLAFIIILCLLYTLRQRIFFVRWAMCYIAAIPAMAFVVAITLVMGFTGQVASGHPAVDPVGITKMLSFWPFVLLYWWMIFILGLVTIKQICSFSARRLPVMCLHLGLLVAVVCATLGSADMQRLTMTTRIGSTEWRATDTGGQMHELPVAIELHNFTIDEYPPKIMAIDNATGAVLPVGSGEHLLVDEGVTSGTVYGWNIEILDNIDCAAPKSAYADTTDYVEWHTMGATSATRIRATSPDGSQTHEGWVSCGSFAFPYRAMRVDSTMSFVMPDREPRRFASEVTIYTQSGEVLDTEIEVNKPAKAEGWKIYQLSYDETKGRWSDISVFELVTDPWLPAVYAGILLMMLGAVALFLTAHKYSKTGNKEENA